METSPNSREGIEEIVKIFQHEYGQYTSLGALSIASDWLRNTLHQELQKALEIQAIEIREEEANEYNKIIEQELQKERERCITKAWSYIVDATHAESWSRDELRKAVQSELDQPDALTK